MPYNPGVNDISGQLRAQGMMRGGEGLLAGLTGGINILQQKKDEDKANIAAIKAFESAFSGLDAIADQLDPKLKQAVEQARLAASDTSLSNKQRAQIGQQSLKGLSELLKIGSDVKQNQAQAEQNKLITQARIDSEKAQMQKAQFDHGVQQLEGIGLASGGRIPPEILAKADPRMIAIATANINRRVKDSIRTVTDTDPDTGLPVEITSDMFGQVARHVKTPEGTRLAPKPQGPANAGPFGILAAMAERGPVLQAIPGGAADRQAREAEAKTQAIATADAKARENTMAKATNVINVVEEAIRYVDAGSGGPVDSALSGVGKFLNPAKDAFAGGLGGTDRLKNRIEVLKSNLSLSSLMALKEASASGASGLGAVNVKELEALTQQVAKLDASLPEHVQRRDLIAVGKEFARMAGLEWDGPSSDKEANDAVPTKKVSRETADEIADEYLRK